MAAAREALDRSAEVVIAEEVSSRYPGATRVVFLRDRITGITFPDAIYNSAVDEMFVEQDDDAKVELARSVKAALKYLSYYGADTFTIEV